MTRPLRRRVDNGELVRPELLRWPLKRARIAARFTIAVTAGDRPLDHVSQSQLDVWITEFPSHRSALRVFTNWASAHGYISRALEVPREISRERRIAMDDEQRLYLAQTLMRDQAEDPLARFAAVLVLLFGQRLTRLVALEIDAVRTANGRTTLALATTAIRLREPLAGLARQVVDHARTTESPWLFPSSHGNRPLSADQLRNRTVSIGLTSALGARNGALASLAAQLPPALLTDQIGLSAAGAARWSKAVGATRGTYVHLRSVRSFPLENKFQFEGRR